jgi:DNA-binding SARP family transcriptional activator
METIALDLLGGFDVRASDGTVLRLPTPKDRALLAFLATAAGRSYSRDSLVALPWGELTHANGRDASQAGTR